MPRRFGWVVMIAALATVQFVAPGSVLADNSQWERPSEQQGVPKGVPEILDGAGQDLQKRLRDNPQDREARDALDQLHDMQGQVERQQKQDNDKAWSDFNKAHPNDSGF
jgi:hypothetical protein